MCRMMLAHGDLDVAKILGAAAQMARGEFSVENAPTQSHPDGFGIVWETETEPTGFRTMRIDAPLWSLSSQEIIERAGPDLEKTKTLAVHARFALLPHQKGLRYSQPIEAVNYDGTVFFMHNGYTPQMHSHLGMPESLFDSEEYCHVVLQLMATGTLEAVLPKLLSGMGDDVASANFLMITKEELVAFNWWPKGYSFREYAQMYRFEDERRLVFSSEIIRTLAPQNAWSPLSRGQLIRLK